MRGTRWIAGALACAFAASATAQDAGPSADDLLESAQAKLDAGDVKGASADIAKARVALIRVQSALNSEKLERQNELIDRRTDGGDPKGAKLRELAGHLAKVGDVKGVRDAMANAAKYCPMDYPIPLSLWREAVETSRKHGGPQTPDLALIQAEVAEIRGLSFKADVPAENQSSEDFGAMVDASIEKDMPKAKRDDVQAGLHRLGLLPERFDMKKEVAGALQSQAAAYYDPKKKKFFNLFSDMSPELVEATAAHELVHALQDQYHDLEAWFRAHGDAKERGARDDDRTFALRCVVEGEATFVQTIWQLEHVMHMAPEQALEATRTSMPIVANMETEQLVAIVRSQTKLASPGGAPTKAIDAMESIQPFVLAPLLAAYMSGAGFIAKVDGGDWREIDRLFDAPPVSSEQCLHPEKYAAKRDDPTPIALPDFPEIAAAGWRDADAAVHGELYVRVLLKRFGVPAKTANVAAAGWDGDVYRAWRAADGRTAIVLATTWDGEGDAREFFDVYKSALAKKYEKLAAEPGDDANAFRYGCGEEPLGTGVLILRGREVFAVEGFPADLLGAIAGKLAASKIDHVE